MLNFQQTKLLSALINSEGVTENYDHYIEGYQSSYILEVIHEIETITDIQIEHHELFKEHENGTVSSTSVFKLGYENQELAQSIYNKQIDSFHRDGVSIGCLT